jgi:hypothetical protein
VGVDSALLYFNTHCQKNDSAGKSDEGKVNDKGYKMKLEE